MRVDPKWTYDALAADYDLRPDYDATVVSRVLGGLRLPVSAPVLEVGAGTGKFTKHLCHRGWDVTAIEPSPSMRALARSKQALARARWIAAIGERLPIRGASMRLVAFASSFNCVEPEAALREAARVLEREGTLLTLWNYRDLTDPLQASVEAILSRSIEGYDPGNRRNAPMAHCAVESLFRELRIDERRHAVDVDAKAWIRAWNAHATVVRQAGDRLPAIVHDIARMVGRVERLRIPYITRIWTATVRN